MRHSNWRPAVKFRSVMLLVIKTISNLVYVCIRLRNMMWRDNKLRILNYHQICPEKRSYPLGIATWCVSKRSFSEQMKILYVGGYNVMSVSEALKYLETGTPFPNKAVAITFDDGYQNNYSYAFPELVRYGIKATFYLTTGYIDKDMLFNWIKPVSNDDDLLFRKALNWQEIEEMRKYGMEFGSHSHTHPDFAKLERSQIDSELGKSLHLLTEHMAIIEKSFVVSFGIWGNSSVILKELLEEHGYTGAFLGRFGAVTHKMNRFDLPRITIYGEDSIKTFKQKIDGAYDWFSSFHSFYHYLRGFIKNENE